MSSLNLRHRPRISYCELDEPGADEYIFCTECADFVYEYCSMHGTLLVIPDDKVPNKTNFPSFVPRAALTIPHIFLHIAPSIIPGAGLGVFSSLTLPNDVRFGPYCGSRAVRPGPDSSYCWQIYDGHNKPSHVIDAADGNNSNWMRYVNCARNWREQNLLAYQYQGQIYYRTIKIIPRFTELLVFYGSEFANALHIDLRLYNSPAGYVEKIGPPLQKTSTAATYKIVELVEEDHLKESPSSKKAKTDTNKKDVKLVNTETSYKLENHKNKVQKLPNGKRSNKPKKVFSASNKGTKLKNKKIISKNPIMSSRDATISEETIAKAEGNSTNQLSITKTTPKLKQDFKKKQVVSKKPSKVPVATTKKLDIVKDVFQNDVNNNLETNSLLTNNTKISHVSNNSHTDREDNQDNTINEKLKLALYYNCCECKYQTVISDSLERHMKLHDRNRRFVCDSCGYRFDKQNLLQRHIQQRHTEAKYSCGVCEYKCISKCTLEIHLRTHTGEKPYACSHCEYKCIQSSDLKRHLRTHTGEKPYACSHCEYKCIQSSHLKTHLRKHQIHVAL